MRFGIVGVGGYWGPNWVRVLRQLDVLVAVCEKDKERLDAVAAKHSLDDTNVKRIDSYEEMLGMDLDGVFIVTPPSAHAEMAIQAMRSGKHVFIEKPMAASTEECYRIKFEAERADRIVMVGHTFVYHPAVRLFKDTLPAIGTLRSLFTVRANFGLYQEVGIVHDLMPHDFSIFTYLCGGFPETIRAEVNPAQDVAYVVAQYGSVACSAFLSWSYPEKTRKLTAVGEKGILEWDLGRPYLLLHRKWAEKGDGNRFQHWDEGTRKIDVSDESEPLMNEALHFMECIRTGRKPLTGSDEGINVVKGLEACR